MTRIDESKHTNVVKFLYGWQNMGNQSLQFQIIKSDKLDAHKTCKDVHTMYPVKCDTTETPLHYLYYSAIDARTFTKPLIQKNSKMLRDDHITMQVCNTIMLHMEIYIKTIPIYQPQLNYTCASIDDMTDLAIQ